MNNTVMSLIKKPVLFRRYLSFEKKGVVLYLSVGFFTSGLPSNVEFLNTIEFWNLHPTGNVSPTTAHCDTQSSILIAYNLAHVIIVDF